MSGMSDQYGNDPGAGLSGSDRSPAYAPVVEEHFNAPRHVGALTGDFETVVSGSAGRREHGTEVMLHIGVSDGRVAEAAFQAFGCPHTIAACSVLTGLLAGRPVAELGGLRMDELAARIGLPVEKTGRLLVIEDALRRCYKAWDNKQLC